MRAVLRTKTKEKVMEQKMILELAREVVDVDVYCGSTAQVKQIASALLDAHERLADVERERDEARREVVKWKSDSDAAYQDYARKAEEMRSYRTRAERAEAALAAAQEREALAWEGVKAYRARAKSYWSNDPHGWADAGPAIHAWEQKVAALDGKGGAA
jgi:chromosome segregation ATPase